MARRGYKNLSSRNPDHFRVRIKGNWCVYCGMLAGTGDHFPPATLSLRGVILPSCQECNGFAGTLSGTDFDGRVKVVKAAISKRYKRVLNMPVWSADELDEVEYAMRRGIEAWQEERRIAQSRLAWNAVTYLASIDHHNDFARFLADYGFTTE
jgi:hypothetical protein